MLKPHIGGNVICRRAIMLLLWVLPFTPATAQTANIDTTAGGNILVYRDSRLDQLVKKQAEYNERLNLTRKYSHGFRIQVLNTQDRAAAISTKTKLLQLFPAEKVYLLYQEPYFKVRWGNFRERADADTQLEQLTRQFPGSFVIPSAIEPKPEWLKETGDGGPM